MTPLLLHINVLQFLELNESITNTSVSKSQEKDLLSPFGQASIHSPSRNKQGAKAGCRNKHRYRVTLQLVRVLGRNSQKWDTWDLLTQS